MQLTSWPIYGESAFSVFVHLRETLGADQVCLFESPWWPCGGQQSALSSALRPCSMRRCAMASYHSGE